MCWFLFTVFCIHSWLISYYTQDVVLFYMNGQKSKISDTGLIRTSPVSHSIGHGICCFLFTVIWIYSLLNPHYTDVILSYTNGQKSRKRLDTGLIRTGPVGLSMCCFLFTVIWIYSLLYRCSSFLQEWPKIKNKNRTQGWSGQGLSATASATSKFIH